MSERDTTIVGARVILERCLGLSEGSHFALLIDETALEVLDPFFLAAQDLDAQLTTLFFSRLQQMTLQSLGSMAQRVIEDADAALLTHSEASECDRFRTQLVSQWRGATRLGTMPGARRFLLEAAADMDVQFIVEQCRKLTLPLLHGKICVVTTYDHAGKAYELRFQLGGMDRIPVQSTGILGPHAWGNVPSGEIFTAPLETSAEGEYLVNGAIGTFTMKGEEAVLTFREGRLVEHRLLSTASTVPYLDDIRKLSEGREDANWNVIAEFGIGVNQGIREFTGRAILDEKIFGTAHIALGNNIGWQGTNRAQIHLDIVTQSPTVVIDGKSVIEKGQHVVKPEEFDNLATYQPPVRYQWPEGAEIASIFRDRAHRDEHGVLRIELPSTQSGRVTEVPLADERTRLLVNQIQRAASRPPALGSLTDVDSRPLSPELTHKLLSLLWSYDLLQPEQQ